MRNDMCICWIYKDIGGSLLNFKIKYLDIDRIVMLYNIKLIISYVVLIER